MKKRILLIISSLFFIGLFFVIINQADWNRKFIFATIGQQPLKLELALNKNQWFQGLSNRTSLCNNCGMLFIFPQKSQQTFVMRKMNFPLDIIWLNDNIVMGYSERLIPEQEEPYTLYHSPTKVNMVLEVPVGFVDRYNIVRGDKLIYEKNF